MEYVNLGLHQIIIIIISSLIPSIWDWLKVVAQVITQQNPTGFAPNLKYINIHLNYPSEEKLVTS